MNFGQTKSLSTFQQTPEGFYISTAIYIGLTKNKLTPRHQKVKKKIHSAQSVPIYSLFHNCTKYSQNIS